MTKEQENAINKLQRMKMDKSHTGSEYNAIKTAIQTIKDLDKMNGIALDLASENEDLIEKLDGIRAEIDSYCSDNRDRNDGLYIAMKIIDKYRKGGE